MSTRLMLLLLVCAIVLATPGQANGQESAWVSRGPAGAINPSYREAMATGVAPTWPADRAIFAMADDWLVRSDDEGATWTYLPRKFGSSVRYLWPAPGVDRNGIVLAMAGEPLVSTRVAVYRTEDGGSSWETVVVSDGPMRMIGNVQLSYSPSFADDGAAFLVANGSLYRSDDFARTWTAVDLAPIGASMIGEGVEGAQLAQQVQISPTFARDRTAYLTLGTATYYPFPLTASAIALRYDESPVVPTIHYQTSVGVAVTRDGGLTWQPAASGLEIDGTPYRFVRNLIVSPTFAADRTLFAWAWGPPEPVRIGEADRLGFANGLFRSQDGGASWQMIWDRPQTVNDMGWGFTQSIGIALSPAFASDGLLVVTTLPLVDQGDNVWIGGFARRGPCAVWRSRDGGTTWETRETPEVPENNRPSACGEPRFGPGDPARIVLGAGPVGGRIVESRDGGETWAELNWPTRTQSWPLILGLAADGSVLVRGSGKTGLWMYGGPPRPEAAAPACPIELDLARFGAVAKKVSLGRWYGCAATPPTNVQIRERVVGSARGIWVEDSTTDWWLLRTDVSSYEGAERHDKLSEPWTGPPTRVVDGVMQRTWEGVLFELRQVDGTRRTYAVSGTKWEALDASP